MPPLRVVVRRADGAVDRPALGEPEHVVAAVHVDLGGGASVAGEPHEGAHVVALVQVASEALVSAAPRRG